MTDGPHGTEIGKNSRTVRPSCFHPSAWLRPANACGAPPQNQDRPTVVRAWPIPVLSRLGVLSRRVARERLSDEDIMVSVADAFS
jgi:hypothetical protein